MSKSSTMNLRCASGNGARGLRDRGTVPTKGPRQAVPKGRRQLARRFNAGEAGAYEFSSPEGATAANEIDTPSPLRGFPRHRFHFPALKRRANRHCPSGTIFPSLTLRVSMVLSCLSLLLCGCERDMADQPKYQPYEASTFFSDGDSARQPVPGTVARGHLETDDHLFKGKVGNEFANTFPVSVDKDLLIRGHQRYNIFCSQCHGPTGDGRGMVVKRGFPQPPSYHIDRLREAKVGYIFDVITNGFGRMAAHGYMIPAEDRWAIIAYVRALQKSQHATKDELSGEDLKQLENDQPK